MKYVMLSFLLIACGPYWADPDPNANVLVTSQYENEPVMIILLPSEKHKPQFDCKEKRGAECAAALYNNAQLFIAEGERLTKKKLFLSAQVEYMQALTRLSEAEIILNKAKTENYEDWSVAVTMGLEKKIKEKIKICQRSIFLLKWKF